MHLHQLPKHGRGLEAVILDRRGLRNDAGAVLIAPDIDQVVGREVGVAIGRRNTVKDVAARLKELPLVQERLQIALPASCLCEGPPVRLISADREDAEERWILLENPDCLGRSHPS